MTTEPLAAFSRPTRAWFAERFGAPTPAQAGAWEAIARGDNALVVAPTGSGKTLSAFLWSLDRLATTPKPEDPKRRCRVLYVSPLKALAYDVERNLRQPLAGIGEEAKRLGVEAPDVSVSMRTGDTPADQRRAFARTPSDILITTPESLFLLLTSAARDALRGIDTVIIDEVHAVCGTKRGAHLALCLERLDALLPQPAQRIGLSATVRPIEETARYVGGPRPVTIVKPPAAKTIELSVDVTVPDLADLTDVDEQGQPSIWPSIVKRLHDLIEANRSTIVFVNSRSLAERLCSRLNEVVVKHDTPYRSQPAYIMAQSSAAAGVMPVLARAHHGSMSREERLQVETGLKSGELRAVVSTSSLELGIDMGAVDLVVLIGSPPSVASGVQRVGRAGHQVGAVSQGVVLPTHRSDLLAATVAAERMLDGGIEELRPPSNPIDILSQHLVSMVAMDDWRVDDLARVVRGAAPFASLSDEALRSVLDMVSGKYPSTGFSGLKPKLVWNRATGRLTARPGAQRLAVLNAGTIPDRGLYGVYLAEGGTGSRVGELDEEMIYESRVGDVFLLGATSWRIESITPDRVLVSPAPGQAARMPFWKGEDVGRPAEFGRAIGVRLRELTNESEANAGGKRHAADGEPGAANAGATATASDGASADESEESPAGKRNAADGTSGGASSRRHGLPGSAGSVLADSAASNLAAYVDQQREHTGAVPDDRTVVVERFRDELGDWRVIVHCLLGARVNRPWALAIAARLRERLGVDAHAMGTDDGIVLRIPDMTDPPGAELLAFEPEAITRIVTEQLTASPLFSARFRECAARALLLPRKAIGRRQPLWQQRQRAAQLFEVAREFTDFPITAEAARECLEEYFDMDALTGLMRSLAERSTAAVDVVTESASPFALSILSSFVAGNLYGEDEPLAERRAAAFNSGLLDELLGEGDQLLDPAVVAEAEAWLQWRDGRDLSGAEDVAELLRVVGDQSDGDLAERGIAVAAAEELEAAGRAVAVTVAEQRRWIAVEDAVRYRDGLGVELPELPPELLSTNGTGATAGSPTPDPLDDLVARYARTHGPFETAECAERFGLPGPLVEAALHRLDADGVVRHGSYTQDGSRQWCAVDVLRLLRRKTLAALRAEISPVPVAKYVSFLADWQGVGGKAIGTDAVADVLDQLQGTAIPASAWESTVLPVRVGEYSPAQLDELTGSGELLWSGSGGLPGTDGWLTFAYAETAPLLLPLPDEEAIAGDLHRELLDALESPRFFRDLTGVVEGDDPEVLEALWDLVWGGWVSNDSLAPLRAKLSGPSPKPQQSRRPRRPGRFTVTRQAVRSAPPSAAGRWYRLPDRDTDPTRRAHAATATLLDRHGVVVRGAAAGHASGFAGQYPILSAMEERGAARRGYFVSGLGAAQFAEPGAVDRLRSATPKGALVLAACDPANPFGAGMPWPARSSEESGHRAGRKAGALVVIVDGELAWYVERGGRTILTYTADRQRTVAAAEALVATANRGGLARVTVTHVDGTPIAGTPVGAALTEAGLRATPKGLKFG
ncbi:DEAD/DEAH box helicase [Stackebrandtia nassauensis]|uniref:DEAD/H associated domain protein n=1 Tax=Stackebrandtia nassauensis (strain DSM 44728 / CIP 108903 / NRRL B-16338 / NBRC 102104 / LLR-40K-21) TaxID=446470 RepID=D3Q2A9_STANL|nr:DEAD/DEAH box helicase [Stackebrandtia nassauensis]ADD43842.1 DEAD/H associated domain protein [Stackebrandtia nassauensis DSM 44728]